MIQRAKMQKGGKLIVPSQIRKQLNLIEGEEIIFDVKEDVPIITSLKHKLIKARTLMKNNPFSISTDTDPLSANNEGAKNHD